MTSYDPYRALAGPLYGQDPWPLRFYSHSFDAVCFNTLACRIVYNRRCFGTRSWDNDGVVHDRPSGTPSSDRWRDDWMAGDIILPDQGQTFPSPLQIEWVSLDGCQHSLTIDLDVIFQDRLILHRVSREQVKRSWLDAVSVNPVSPGIMVEVNDRSVHIYMRAFIATETEQVPGNDRSHFRNDLIEAWTDTY